MSRAQLQLSAKEGRYDEVMATYLLLGREDIAPIVPVSEWKLSSVHPIAHTCSVGYLGVVGVFWASGFIKMCCS